MRAGLFALIWLAGSPIAFAKDIPLDDIRPIQTDTTDIFAVLETLQHAQTALQRRDYSTAREGFESVLMHDPNLEAARTGLRKIFIAEGNFRDARNFMEDDMSPDSIIIRIRSGEIDAPLDLLKTTLETSTDPRLWTLQGQLQDARQDHVEARYSYAMAGMFDARAGLAINNIGQSHWLAGEYEMALKAFTEAVSLNPSDTQFDNNRRRTLIQLGRYGEAISGLDSERAGLFLAHAGDKAAENGDINLARLLYQKSLNVAPRFNPHVETKLTQLKQ